jgi:phosphonopyruvate decarboxylase
MINVQTFYDYLSQHLGIKFFTGVPDSLLKNFLGYLFDNVSSDNHIITANEGLSISLASGNYLATQNIPLVYMQNSGIGNAINPLLSLADKEVYGIPMLLVIGWRGEPGVKDEPQHIKQGKVTPALLKAMDIPYKVLSLENEFKYSQILNDLYIQIKNNKCPHALLIKKGVFQEYKSVSVSNSRYDMLRETAIEQLAMNLSSESIIVSTTGKTSRELFELRSKYKQSHDKDFLCVGSMGHANHIALGIALQKPKKKIFCFDGDGALLMHLGALSQIGVLKPRNFIHILFNNGAHDSVGGQATVGYEVDFSKMALASGYESTIVIEEECELTKFMEKINKLEGPALVEIRIRKGARTDLGRPTISPKDNIIRFIDTLRN